MNRIAVRITGMIAISSLFTITAAARPHKVIVLPLDGTADPATRARFTASVQKLARLLDGEIALGKTTFAETAAAVGCDPDQPKCVDEVLATLAVDEIVWGAVTDDRGQMSLVVHRATKGSRARDITTTIRPQDAADKTSSSLLPLFQSDAQPVSDDGRGSALPVAHKKVEAIEPASGSGSGAIGGDGAPVPPGSPVDTHDRNLGIGLSVGGGVALVLGFALWSSESSLQDQINAHDTNTAKDLAAVRDLEDRANKYAWGGNAMIIVGLAVGGFGAYYLWKNHKSQLTATVTPVPAEQGAGATFTLRGQW